MFGVYDVSQTSKWGVWSSGECSRLDLNIYQDTDGNRELGLGEFTKGVASEESLRESGGPGSANSLPGGPAGTRGSLPGVRNLLL